MDAFEKNEKLGATQVIIIKKKKTNQGFSWYENTNYTVKTFKTRSERPSDLICKKYWSSQLTN